MFFGSKARVQNEANPKISPIPCVGWAELQLSVENSRSAQLAPDVEP
jgi:hypothetical protein